MSTANSDFENRAPGGSPTEPSRNDECRLLVENTPEILALISAEGKILFANAHAEKVLGWRPQDISGRNIFDLVHPDDYARAAQEYADTLSNDGERYPTILRLRDAADNWVPFEIIANSQVRNPDIRAVIFSARDLRFRQDIEKAIANINQDAARHVEHRTTELARVNAALRIENQARRLAESEMQQSVSLLHATLDSTADGILVVSRTGKVTSCNKKFIEMWQLSCELAMGKNDRELVALVSEQLQHPNEFIEKIEALYADPDATSFDVLHLRDGRVMERYSQPQRLGDEIVGRVWSFRDVTRARQLELEIRQSQKMEALGRLAGGIAHDFNNLLMLISGYVTQISEHPLDAECCGACEQILGITRRAASVTRQLLAFSRKSADAPSVTDLNQIIMNMEPLLRRLVSEPIRLTISVTNDPLPVYIDVSQVEVTVMNLVINAQDAMPEGGFLTISTRRQPDAHNKDSPPFAVLEVTDTGHGMTPEVRTRIFEPFFTTKQLGKGTGLGLSTVFGMVERAGGHIDVQSEINEGTTFRVFFPEAATLVAETAPSAASPVPGGNETILLAEDESGIRAMTKVYLESLGYKVIEAADGTDALNRAKDYSGPIDLVLTDIVMPGLRGDAAVDQIRKDRPNVRAIFMSGYTDQEVANGNDRILYKPFDFPELARRVRSVLDQVNLNERKTA